MKAEFLPQRDDEVARWLKQKRISSLILVTSSLLDDYRLHADTGTPLDFDVTEGPDE